MRSASARPARDGETSGTGRLEEWSSPDPQGSGTESGLYLAGVYFFLRMTGEKSCFILRVERSD